MNVSEAAGLIIQASSFTSGDNIFMLEMGERIRVDDLAPKMIRKRELRPEIDIPIDHTGIRLGEKLHEELAFAEEGREPTEDPLVHRLRLPVMLSVNGELRRSVARLLELLRNGNGQALVEALMMLAHRQDDAPNGSVPSGAFPFAPGGLVKRRNSPSRRNRLGYLSH